nr:MAG TPA: ATPase [Caudoviricetes sp.]
MYCRRIEVIFMTIDSPILLVLLSAICSSISAVIVCFLNQYFFQKKKEERELERSIKKERLYKLYLPIRKLLYRRVNFDEGYIGLDDSDVQEIIGIIDKNIDLADDALEDYYWRFYEELGYRYLERGQQPDSNEYEFPMDEDRKFLEFTESGYKKLKCELHMI